MALTDQRQVYRPFEYPKAYEFYRNQQLVHWIKDEIKIAEDMMNWQNDLTETEKAVVGGILKGFSQMEILVGDYWRNVPKWFPKPEIGMMCSTFSYFETIHQDSYALINESLGLDDFASFLYDEDVKKKLDYFIDIPEQSTLEDKAKSLAIFSAFAEGCMLFSSFAVLLSFQRENLLKGVGQIVSFSIRDENCLSGDTQVITKEGIFEIKDLVGKEVTVFDGENWVKCDNFRAFPPTKLFKITFEDGTFIKCTENHNHIMLGEYSKPTCEVNLNDRFHTYMGDGQYSSKKCISIESLDCEEVTYCPTITTTHKFLLANGIITGNCHSEGGCWLFNQLCSEFEHLRETVNDDIINAAKMVYELEKKFIDNLFNDDSIRTLNPFDLKQFIKHRINLKLKEIGYDPIYEVDTESLSRMSWFDSLSSGREFLDFFSGIVSEYSKVEYSANDLF